MFGALTVRVASRLSIGLVSVLLASLVASPVASIQASAAQGRVQLEWLGHMVYRITSPQGVVVVTSPQLGNADGPIAPLELERTDFVLVPNSHDDDMGNPIEVNAVSGATVIAPGPLGRWLIDQGLPQSDLRRAGIADRFILKNITFKIAPSHHDNTLANGADGGPAAAYFVTFENGFTVFFNGHSTIISELAIYASIYQPDLAILGLNQAVEFAQVARLISMENPKLRTVIPSHIRPGAAILAEATREMERLGLAHLMFMPELRTVYEY